MTSPAHNTPGHNTTSDMTALRDAVAQERVGFLAGEPDRWRNTSDRPLRHLNGLDHYFDLEYLGGVGVAPSALPIFRHEFAVQLAAARAATARTVEQLMGNKPEDRFAFISERAQFVSEEGLDV